MVVNESLRLPSSEGLGVGESQKLPSLESLPRFGGGLGVGLLNG